MRKKIVAGNWKMNLSYAEAMALTDTVAEGIHEEQKSHVILAPPFIYLNDIESQLRNHAEVSVAAQNCSDKISGAYTGEISAGMLATIGVDYVIIGHSERRNYFHEGNELLAAKVKSAFANDLLPIYCCGETQDERKSGKHFDLVKKQIETGLFHLPKAAMQECVIAYEPVWAIGTGVNASPSQAQEMHRFIRTLIKDKYDEATAEAVSILYGGSVTPANCAELFSCADIDGGLVGGASLKANDFMKIVEAMEKTVRA